MQSGSIVPSPPPQPSTILEAHHIPQGTSSKAGFHNVIIAFCFRRHVSAKTTEATPWDIPSSFPPAAPPPSLTPSSSMPFALICPEDSANPGRGRFSRSAIVARAINTLAPTGGAEVKAWPRSVHYQTNNIVLSRQPGNRKTRGIPAVENLICWWKYTKLVPQSRRVVFDLICTIVLHFIRNDIADGHWQSRKSLQPLPSFANGMDSMASAHWWTCLVMFSLFLNRPPHPFLSQCLEVAETCISLSVFLIAPFFPPGPPPPATNRLYKAHNWSDLHPNK